MAYRIDSGVGTLRPPRRLPDGRLVADGLLTRVGVFRYFNSDGSERLELRLPEDVFAPAALESFALAPLTDDHPPGLLDAQTMRRHAVGAVGDARRDGEYVRAPVSVFDADVISKMERGKVQLSPGYNLDLVQERGEHPLYGRYDARQTNIRVNHVALVDAGRAGPEARVRMDARDPIGFYHDSKATSRSLHAVPVEIIISNILGAHRASQRG